MNEKAKQTKREVQRIENPDTPTFYVNNVEMRSSQWDVRFVMGEVDEASDDTLAVKELVRVYMSPQHAKVFAEVLAAQIKRYEDTFGPINVGPLETD